MALQVWLPLNGNLKNKGCANVTFTQQDLTYTSGKIGQCAYFNNIKTNTVTIPALSGATKFSIAIWIKVPSDQTITTWSDVLTFGCSSSSYTTSLRLEQMATKLGWFANSVLTNNNGAGAYPLNVRNDTWYHVAITCDGQKMYKYWDGELIGEYEIPSDYIGNYLTGTMSIGDTGNYCYLNDVRVYDHCLSTVEIKEISRGLVLHYKLDEPLAENVELSLTIISHDSTRTGTTEDVSKAFDNTNSKWYEASKHVTNIVVETDSVFPANKLGLMSANDNDLFNERNLGQFDIYGSNDNLNYELLYSCTDQNYGSERYTWYYYNFYNKKHYTYYKFSVIGRNAGIQIGEIKLLFDNAIVRDCSGYGNNGSITANLEPSLNSPRYDSGVFTENTDSYSSIKRNNLNLPDGPTTLAFWSKPTINDTVDTSKIDIKFSNCHYFTYINFTYFVHNGDYKYRYINPWLDENWHFIVGVFDGTNTNIYVDGSIINIQSSARDDATVFQNNLVINLRGNNLSDFRIYATALSAEDIKQLYEVSAKIDNKKGLHCFELEEHNTSDNTKLFKTGIFKASEFNEIEDAMKIKEDLDIESNQLIEM